MSRELLLPLCYGAFLFVAAEVLFLAARRVLRRGGDPPTWPHHDIADFYRGLGAVLLLLAGFVTLVASFRQDSPAGASLCTLVAIASGGAAWHRRPKAASR